MAVQELSFGVGPLVRSFRSARRWLWLQRSLRTLAQSLCAAALFALLAAPHARAADAPAAAKTLSAISRYSP